MIITPRGNILMIGLNCWTYASPSEIHALADWLKDTMKTQFASRIGWDVFVSLQIDLRSTSVQLVPLSVSSIRLPYIFVCRMTG